jgi:hypothetical protein
MYCPPAYIGLPVPYVLPVPNALPYVDHAGRIVLLNPLETGATVSYVVASQAFSMDAGMMQDIELATTVIRFDRGGGFGEAAYTLTPASYKFVVTDHGWDLVTTSFQATFDNSANTGDFSLVLDGAVVTIPAGSKQSLKSAYPIVVSFNNGIGETVSKQLANGATYTIGVNVATSGWDLFPGDAAATGVGSPEAAYTVAATEPIAPPVPAPMP